MEHQKILNLLNEANNSKFVIRKWNIVNNSKSNHDATNELTYNTEILKSNLCDYQGNFILVRDDITIEAAPTTQVAFKNCAPFTKCTTKTDETTIDDAEDLDLVIPMYSLIEYDSNNFETTGSLQFYSKVKQLILMQTLLMIIILSILKIRLNYYGTKLLNLLQAANGILKNTTIAVPFKYLSNFWRSLKTSSINCKVE